MRKSIVHEVYRCFKHDRIHSYNEDHNECCLDSVTKKEESLRNSCTNIKMKNIKNPMNCYSKFDLDNESMIFLKNSSNPIVKTEVSVKEAEPTLMDSSFPILSDSLDNYSSDHITLSKYMLKEILDKEFVPIDAKSRRTSSSISKKEMSPQLSDNKNNVEICLECVENSKENSKYIYSKYNRYIKEEWEEMNTSNKYSNNGDESSSIILYKHGEHESLDQKARDSSIYKYDTRKSEKIVSSVKNNDVSIKCCNFNLCESIKKIEAAVKSSTFTFPFTRVTKEEILHRDRNKHLECKVETERSVSSQSINNTPWNKKFVEDPTLYSDESRSIEKNQNSCGCTDDSTFNNSKKHHFEKKEATSYSIEYENNYNVCEMYSKKHLEGKDSKDSRKKKEKEMMKRSLEAISLVPSVEKLCNRRVQHYKIYDNESSLNESKIDKDDLSAIEKLTKEIYNYDLLTSSSSSNSSPSSDSDFEYKSILIHKNMKEKEIQNLSLNSPNNINVVSNNVDTFMDIPEVYSSNYCYHKQRKQLERKDTDQIFKSNDCKHQQMRLEIHKPLMKLFEENHYAEFVDSSESILSSNVKEINCDQKMRKVDNLFHNKTKVLLQNRLEEGKKISFNSELSYCSKDSDSNELYEMNKKIVKKNSVQSINGQNPLTDRLKAPELSDSNNLNVYKRELIQNNNVHESVDKKEVDLIQDSQETIDTNTWKDQSSISTNISKYLIKNESESTITDKNIEDSWNNKNPIQPLDSLVPVQYKDSEISNKEKESGANINSVISEDNTYVEICENHKDSSTDALSDNKKLFSDEKEQSKSTICELNKRENLFPVEKDPSALVVLPANLGQENKDSEGKNEIILPKKSELKKNETKELIEDLIILTKKNGSLSLNSEPKRNKVIIADALKIIDRNIEDNCKERKKILVIKKNREKKNMTEQNKEQIKEESIKITSIKYAERNKKISSKERINNIVVHPNMNCVQDTKKESLKGMEMISIDPEEKREERKDHRGEYSIQSTEIINLEKEDTSSKLNNKDSFISMKYLNKVTNIGTLDTSEKRKVHKNDKNSHILSTTNKVELKTKDLSKEILEGKENAPLQTHVVKKKRIEQLNETNESDWSITNSSNKMLRTKVFPQEPVDVTSRQNLQVESKIRKIEITQVESKHLMNVKQIEKKKELCEHGNEEEQEYIKDQQKMKVKKTNEVNFETKKKIKTKYPIEVEVAFKCKNLYIQIDVDLYNEELTKQISNKISKRSLEYKIITTKLVNGFIKSTDSKIYKSTNIILHNVETDVSYKITIHVHSTSFPLMWLCSSISFFLSKHSIENFKFKTPPTVFLKSKDTFETATTTLVSSVHNNIQKIDKNGRDEKISTKNVPQGKYVKSMLGPFQEKKRTFVTNCCKRIIEIEESDLSENRKEIEEEKEDEGNDSDDQEDYEWDSFTLSSEANEKDRNLQGKHYLTKKVEVIKEDELLEDSQHIYNEMSLDFYNLNKSDLKNNLKNYEYAHKDDIMKRRTEKGRKHYDGVISQKDFVDRNWNEPIMELNNKKKEKLDRDDGNVRTINKNARKNQDPFKFSEFALKNINESNEDQHIECKELPKESYIGFSKNFTSVHDSQTSCKTLETKKEDSIPFEMPKDFLFSHRISLSKFQKKESSKQKNPTHENIDEINKMKKEESTVKKQENEQSNIINKNQFNVPNNGSPNKSIFDSSPEGSSELLSPNNATVKVSTETTDHTIEQNFSFGPRTNSLEVNHNIVQIPTTNELSKEIDKTCISELKEISKELPSLKQTKPSSTLDQTYSVPLMLMSPPSIQSPSENAIVINNNDIPLRKGTNEEGYCESYHKLQDIQKKESSFHSHFENNTILLNKMQSIINNEQYYTPQMKTPQVSSSNTINNVINNERSINNIANRNQMNNQLNMNRFPYLENKNSRIQVPLYGFHSNDLVSSSLQGTHYGRNEEGPPFSLQKMMEKKPELNSSGSVNCQIVYENANFSQVPFGHAKENPTDFYGNEINKVHCINRGSLQMNMQGGDLIHVNKNMRTMKEQGGFHNCTNFDNENYMLPPQVNKEKEITKKLMPINQTMLMNMNRLSYNNSYNYPQYTKQMHLQQQQLKNHFALINNIYKDQTGSISLKKEHGTFLKNSEINVPLNKMDKSYEYYPKQFSITKQNILSNNIKNLHMNQKNVMSVNRSQIQNEKMAHMKIIEPNTQMNVLANYQNLLSKPIQPIPINQNKKEIMKINPHNVFINNYNSNPVVPLNFRANQINYQNKEDSSCNKEKFHIAVPSVGTTNSEVRRENIKEVNMSYFPPSYLTNNQLIKYSDSEYKKQVMNNETGKTTQENYAHSTGDHYIVNNMQTNQMNNHVIKNNESMQRNFLPMNINLNQNICNNVYGKSLENNENCISRYRKLSPSFGGPNISNIPNLSNHRTTDGKDISEINDVTDKNMDVKRFTLKIQLSESSWRTLHFHNKENNNEKALQFVKENNLKQFFVYPLKEKMDYMLKNEIINCNCSITEFL